jgi:hypothetical protein
MHVALLASSNIELSMAGVPDNIIPHPTPPSLLVQDQSNILSANRCPPHFHWKPLHPMLKCHQSHGCHGSERRAGLDLLDVLQQRYPLQRPSPPMGDLQRQRLHSLPLAPQPAH